MRKTLTVVFLVVAMLLLTTGAAYARPDAWTTICVHQVRRGQTLLCIARAYGVRWQAIARVNRLANPNLIYPGQRLHIPDVYGSNPAGPVCAKQCGGGPGPGCACSTYHTVEAGENLYRISQTYCRNMWHVARCNGIVNLNLIYAGQSLCIP